MRFIKHENLPNRDFCWRMLFLEANNSSKTSTFLAVFLCDPNVLYNKTMCLSASNNETFEPLCGQICGYHADQSLLPVAFCFSPLPN